MHHSADCRVGNEGIETVSDGTAGKINIADTREVTNHHVPQREQMTGLGRQQVRGILQNPHNACTNRAAADQTDGEETGRGHETEVPVGVTAGPEDCAVSVHRLGKNTSQTHHDTGNLVPDVRVVVAGKSGGRTCRISGFCSGATQGNRQSQNAIMAPSAIMRPPKAGANMAFPAFPDVKTLFF